VHVKDLVAVLPKTFSAVNCDEPRKVQAQCGRYREWFVKWRVDSTTIRDQETSGAVRDQDASTNFG
jgi:hypothetical protein